MANEKLQNTRRKRFIFRPWKVVATLVVLIIVAVIAVSSYFVWNRWDRYDDYRDIQGQWYVFGTSVPITITENVLDFNADTSYHYTLDSENKTITFTLGNMEGTAHYCFYENRQVLVLEDGSDFTRWGSAGDDFLAALQEFARLSAGRIPQYPEGDGIIVLSRTPDKYGWGDYRYTYKDALVDEPSKSQKAEDASAAPDESSSGGASAGSVAPDTDEPDLPDQPRVDDPFGAISDTPLELQEDGAMQSGSVPEKGEGSDEGTRE